MENCIHHKNHTRKRDDKQSHDKQKKQKAITLTKITPKQICEKVVIISKQHFHYM